MGTRAIVQKTPSNTIVQYAPNNGLTIPTTNTSLSTMINPIPNAPMLLGVDFIKQAFPSGLTPVTFTNLPTRGTSNAVNKQQNQPTPLVIQTGDYLIFKVSMSGPGTVTPRILDTSNAIYLSPGLSQGTYRTFQALVTLTAPATLIIYGELFLYKGTQT